MVTLEDVAFLKESEEAIRVEYEGIFCWIPKSQIDNLDTVMADITNSTDAYFTLDSLVIPEWLAWKKEFI